MRTIAILMDRDLLKNTEDIVPALGPLCSEIEGKTLKELDDGALSRIIADLSLRTMILEIESSRREERRREIFVRLKNKYFEYCVKYREFRRRFREGGNMQSLHDELKEKDDEMVKVIEKCSVLEGTLRGMEEELEVSRGVAAQCSDLQAQLVELWGQLEKCRLQLEALNGEVAEKNSELEKAEFSHLDARRKSEMLELAIRTLRAEWENDQSTAKAKEDRLEERIRELEKDNFILHDRVAALEAEKAQLLAQPSSSRTSDFSQCSSKII
ncbi:uncharacterized protein [Nicotiana tomentosiformis]|uniref:uncharacterized protein n=1 Tax=Nicotiana tomentosiformis TaxID=4098 RepID=UPI00388C991A